MIVMKFGGTSVGDPEAIKRVAAIVKSRRAQKPAVVVSALSGVTNKLVELGRTVTNRKEKGAARIRSELERRHVEVIQALGISSLEFDELLRETSEKIEQLCDQIASAGDMVKHLVDEILSFGEYLSSHIVAATLRLKGIDALTVDVRDILLTDSRFGSAQPQFEESAIKAKTVLLPIVEGGRIPILQGFVGRDGFGRTTTLGRGGSDYSATLLGAMMNAKKVEIWSDVDGVLTADPTIVSNAKRIRYMTFREAAELAYFGAKVLHPATLLPAINRNIPVYVLNSMRPADSGTKIAREKKADKSSSCIVKSIAYKEGLSIVTVTSTRMLMAHGFIASIFEVFNNYRTPVDLVSTSEVSVSMTVDNIENLEDIRRELGRFANVEVEHNRAIVCVVGEQMKKTPGMPAKIFSLLDDVAVDLISQGASEINISFVVDESKLPMIINRLHDKFFSDNLDPEIFAQ